jgi:cystathionine gamma-synthase
MRAHTLYVHAGAEPDRETGAVATPIHLSTTFEHGPAGERRAGFEYVREANPNQARLEEALARIEGGDTAQVYASGMAAAATLLQSLPSGAHLLIPKDVYAGVRSVAFEFLGAQGIVAEAVDTTHPAAVAAAIRPSTRLIWIETPSNPRIEIADIALTAELAHRHGALLAVDNTFASPVLQNPLALGADVVMHSTTKYIGGHSDVMGGALVFARNDELAERCAHRRHVLGSVMAPFNAWLTLRGLRSIGVRVERHAANARRVAAFLAGQPGIAVVHHPSLPGHAGHAIAKRQMRDFGGMLSVEFAGGRAAALAFAGALEVFTNATSLGGTESLVEHRASVEGPQPVTSQALLRFSVGIEDADDLIADLSRGIDAIRSL